MVIQINLFVDRISYLKQTNKNITVMVSGWFTLMSSEWGGQGLG